MQTHATRAYVAVGSNLGDRDAHLALGVRLLRVAGGIEVLAVSPVYETVPVGPEPQGRYLNAALEIATLHAPGPLLVLLLDVEKRAGRTRGADRWGPRTLDLDLLLYGDACIDEPGLTVPHPRLHERAFVLEPLRAIAPDARHPGLGATIASLADRLGPTADVVPWPRRIGA